MTSRWNCGERHGIARLEVDCVLLNTRYQTKTVEETIYTQFLSQIYDGGKQHIHYSTTRDIFHVSIVKIARS